MKQNISGSSDVGGGSLNGSVTGSNAFGTTVQNSDSGSAFLDYIEYFLILRNHPYNISIL